MSKSKKPLVIVLAVVVGILVIYVALGFFFSSHFVIGSTVNGVKAGFKSPAKVFSTIEKDAKNYTVDFVYDDDSVELSVNGEELGFGVSYTKDDVAELLKEQNGFLWVSDAFKGIEYNTKKGNSYDLALVESTVDKLNFTPASTKKEEANAYIEYDSSKKEFVIVDEIYGNEIDKKEVVNSLIDAMENFATKINIDEGSCYKKPDLRAEDKNMQKALATANKYLGTKITYDLEVTKEEPDTDTRASWIAVDGDEVGFDEEALGAFVDEMGKKYNTFGKKKHFVTTSGYEIDVPAGDLGWKIAYRGEIEQIEADLTEGKDVTRDFVYLYTAASHGENDYGENFVEVDLTDQHVYIHKEGEIVFDTDCVTGNVVTGHDTHTGAYAIAYKAKDATLRGADYTSFVNYWMPFHIGEGLHDATWRSRFGGTIYQGGGSHGCVNLPLSAAKEIYEIVDKGWPVLVFYTGTTEAEIEEARGPYMHVMSLISSIETVTADSAGKIAEARAAYDALADEHKAHVENYETLVLAEQTLRNIQLGIQ